MYVHILASPDYDKELRFNGKRNKRLTAASFKNSTQPSQLHCGHICASMTYCMAFNSVAQNGQASEKIVSVCLTGNILIPFFIYPCSFNFNLHFIQVWYQI